MSCKWCSYNYEQHRIKAIKNPIKRFLSICFFDEDWVFQFPKCKHPKVYRQDTHEERVYGKISRWEIYCSTAREESSGRFHCCGKEGKYWEAKDE